MKDYEFSDYLIFSSASSVADKMKVAIGSGIEEVNSCKDRLCNESVFMGPIADSCKDGFTQIDGSLNNLRDNFATISEYLTNTSSSYAAGDQNASSKVANLSFKDVALGAGAVIAGKKLQDSIVTSGGGSSYNSGGVSGYSGGVSSYSGGSFSSASTDSNYSSDTTVSSGNYGGNVAATDYLNRANLSGSKLDFVNSIKSGAVQAYNEYGVLPSLTLAQAILESGWGQHKIGNNIFGIKAGSSWTGKVLYRNTGEQTASGASYRINAAFRDYDSVDDSIVDHAKLLTTSRYKGVIAAKNYKEACYAVKAAGYATAVNYSSQLINLIEKYGLNQWDPV